MGCGKSKDAADPNEADARKLKTVTVTDKNELPIAQGDFVQV